jgi:hypothetical protein
MHCFDLKNCVCARPHENKTKPFKSMIQHPPVLYRPSSDKKKEGKKERKKKEKRDVHW